MEDQRDGADHGDGLHVAFRAVAHHHPAQPEQGGGNGGRSHHVDRAEHDAGQGQTPEVNNKPQHDPEDEAVRKDRLQHLPGQFRRMQAGAVAAHQFHQCDAEGEEQRRVDGQDCEVPVQRLWAIGALGDRQAQQQRI